LKRGSRIGGAAGGRAPLEGAEDEGAQAHDGARLARVLDGAEHLVDDVPELRGQLGVVHERAEQALALPQVGGQALDLVVQVVAVDELAERALAGLDVVDDLARRGHEVPRLAQARLGRVVHVRLHEQLAERALAAAQPARDRRGVVGEALDLGVQRLVVEERAE